MSPLFSRRTIIAAADTLQSLGHDGIDRFLLELGLSKELAQKGVTLSKRTASLAKVAVDQPQLLTAEGGKLSNALVFRAQSLCERTPSVDFKLRQAFEEAMQAEGFVLATQPEGAIVRISHTVEPRRPRRKKVVELGLETVVDRVGDRTKLEVSPRRVFLVHGHDSSARESVARFLEKLSFEVIILHEKPNRGKTLIEKFESNSDVGFAVVLLTPDDFGSARDAAANPRARQNVVLEWGYFVGKLGRERVVALKKSEVELPSDVIGIVWESYDEKGAWKAALARELQAAGYKIDWASIAG